MKRFAFLCLLASTTAVHEPQVQGTKLDEVARAAGKMWPFEDLPLEHLRQAYDFTPTPEWLEHVRRSSLRWDGRGSASFVSPNGLILTNHHCVRNRLAELGPEVERDGYAARSREEERRLPGAVAHQLVRVDDVTDRVFAGVDFGNATPDLLETLELNRSALLEEARSETPELMLELHELYRGARVHLYRYRVLDDLRLVFAPEASVGYFGGHADNFSYPHYALDFALVRAYADDQPLDSSDHYLRWSPQVAQEGDAVLSSGHPGATTRHHTLAELELARATYLPIEAAVTQGLQAALADHLSEHPEEAERWMDMEFSLVTGAKSVLGRRTALYDPKRLESERLIEDELRRAVRSNPDLAAQVGDAWDAIESTVQELTEVRLRLWYQTPASTPSRWFGPLKRAIAIVNACQPDLSEEQAQQKREQAREGIELELFDRELFIGHLERGRAILGPEDPAIQAILAGQEPAEAVRVYLEDSRIG